MTAVDMEVQACDTEVDRFGRIVCQLRDALTEDVERFVQAVCAISGESVDWQYVNKYPTILTTGEVEFVMDLIVEFLPDHESKGISIYRATDHQ
jgi:hypothetical protein